MIALLAALLVAQPLQDTSKVVLLSVSAHSATADTLLIVRTAGLSRGQAMTASALRTNLSDAIRRVYNLGLFSQVEAETARIADGIRVRFVTTEFPKLKSVAYDGYRRVRKKDFETKVKPKEGEILTDRKIFDWQQEILKLYKEKGFLLVKIDHETTKPDSLNEVVLTYKIDEGDPVRIRSISISGNDHFTNSQIGIHLVNRPKRWYRKATLKEDEFVKDLDRVVEFYKERGFIDAKVLDYDMKFDQGWADITISVSEGTRYYFGNVTIKGDSVLKEADLRKLIHYTSGGPYNAKLAQSTLQDLFAAYSEEGYIYAQVSPVENIRSDTVDITYDITERKPAVVRLVSIEGNEQTHDNVIRREISSLPGYTFRRSEVMRSQRDIYNLGFFDDVSLDYHPADTNGSIDLIYKVKEKSFFGTVGAGVTYSATDGLTGYVELQQPNLFGRGQQANVKVEKGAKVADFALSFTEPWLFDRPMSAGADLSYQTTIYDYYSNQELGGGFSFSRPLPLDYTRGYLALRVADAYVPPSSIKSGYKVTDTLFSIDGDTVHKTSFTPSVSFTRDSRDYIFNAFSGSSTTYQLDLSLGGINFQRHIFDMSQYLPLFWKFTLMGRTRLGYITGFKSTDRIPVYERFTPGGTGLDGIRGYDDRSLGPTDGGYIIGGQAEAIFSLEYKLRVNRQLSFLAFGDAGNAWNSINQFSLSDLKRGAGVGVRLEIPMLGLLGFDFGYGFDKATPGWVPHFQIGRTF
ncbi:MAG TPA: outer membrane protein assembly factor BamA [bacterium]|nr:outer membrane protein assembly factor BamA [bacterium]